jgi:hypothetical protein
MNDALAVRGRKGIRYLGGINQSAIERQRSAFQYCRQRFTLDVLHHEIGSPVLFSNIVKAADVGVVQGRDGSCFTLESAAKVFALGEIGPDEFDRNYPAQTCVARTKHLPHSAVFRRTSSIL